MSTFFSFLFFLCLIPSAVHPSTAAMILGAEMTKHNISSELHDQNAGIAKINKAINNFQLWLNSTSILTYYATLVNTYNNNLAIEQKFVTYMQNTAASSIKPPAGYRLPAYRQIYTPCSEVLSKSAQLSSILSTRRDAIDRMEMKLFGMGSFPPQRISELQAMISDYQSDDMNPSRVINGGLLPQANSAIQNQVTTATTTLGNWEAVLVQTQNGLKAYIQLMGLSIDQLTNNPNDMFAAVQTIEDDLLEVAPTTLGSPSSTQSLAQAIQTFIVARYSGSADDAHNPYTVPLTEAQYITIPYDSIDKTVTEYRQKLISVDTKIRNLLAPYCSPGAMPPSIDQMLASSGLSPYMFRSYMGYWIQQVANQLQELALAGFDIVSYRYQLAQKTHYLWNTYVTPIFAIDNDFSTIDILQNATSPTAAIAALQTAVSNVMPGTLDSCIAAIQKQFPKDIEGCRLLVGHIQQGQPSMLTFHAKTATVAGVAEVVAFRRTQMVISMLGALFANKKFTQSTYKTDAFGPVPEALFPQGVPA